MNNKETLQNYNNRLNENNITLDSILETINTLPEVKEIVLQDKAIEITENGTQTITADEGYDGLNNVSVTTNIEASGGAVEKGFKINGFDEEGYPNDIEFVGMTAIPIHYGSTTNYNTVPYGVFSRVKKITFNEGIESIDEYAFRYNKQLTVLKLPDSVKTVGYYAFDNCSSLIQVSMSGITNLYSVGNYGSFSNCTFLKAVWLGGAVTSIGGHAFKSDYALGKIFINLPRTSVEALSDYSLKWGATNATVICNDDEGFMTQEEFDAIDWATYIG